MSRVKKLTKTVYDYPQLHVPISARLFGYANLIYTW